MLQDISRISTQPLLKNIRMEMREKKAVSELMRKAELSQNNFKKWMKSANSTTYVSGHRQNRHKSPRTCESTKKRFFFLLVIFVFFARMC